MTTEQEQQLIYHPLLSKVKHKMDGWLLVNVRRGEYKNDPILTFANGESYYWYQYEEDRMNWEEEGFPDENGDFHDFPQVLQYTRCGNLPI